MAQRYDIVKIDFQANARGANAAIESLRKAAEDCNDRVTKLKKDLAEGIKMGKSTEEIENIRKSISAAQKEARSFQKGYDELAKGMRTLDTAIKAFNDGSLAQMSQAFQKAANNAAKLTRTKLDPLSDTYKEDYRQLTALMDATQQNFARMQGDAQQMVKTLKDGGKVSVAALQEEIKAQEELLSVLAQTDKGYQQTEKRLAVMQQYLRAMGGDYEFVRQNITDTKKVSDDMLRNMYAELQKTNQEGKVTKDIMRENAAAMKEIRTEQARRVENVLGGNLGQQSEQSIRAAIANAKELLVTYKSNSREAQTLSAQIVNAEEHLRTHGIEAARAAQREAAAIKTQEEAEKQLQATMNKRLQSLKTLSADALAETRKYWEAQRNGAEQGTVAYKKAEDALRRIDNLQKNRRVAELDNILGDPKKHGVAEVRNAVQEMEKLRDSVQQGIPAWQHYNKMVEQGKAYLDNLAKSEAAQRINQQMQGLSTLSVTGLQEVKRYWETMVAGAAHGSDKLDQYRAKLEQVLAEEKARSAAQAQQRVGILGGNFGGYSEAEIRQAIEAGKELIQTYKTADPAAQQLAKNIVAAEEHLKQYGVEAERAAVKEAEAIKKAAEERRKNDALMEAQLSKGSSLTQEALKAQEQYWQRLINDPKTASASLAQYQANLDKVRAAQQQMMQQRGQDALNFFRGDTSNASADQIKQQTDAMKKYRDSLPQKDNAAVIAEIDGYLQEAAAITQKATEQTMTWKQAMQVSAQAGIGSFKGTTEQLNQAKKTLEDMSAKAVKGGLAWRRMQEALQRIELELKNVGTLSKEVQAVLDQPKGKSFNALKQAVEQGRLALNAMDRSTKEGQKAFDELAAKIKAADFELKQLGNSSKGTASAFDKAWSRLKTYVGLYVGAAVAMQKLTAAMGDLLTLSDKMGEVRKTTGFTADEVGRLSNNLAKLDTRTSLTSLMELSSLAGSVGLKTQEQVQGFTEAADQLIVALPELGNESARTIIKIANATGDLEKNGGNVRETLEKVGSTIIALRANSASAAGPITDFVSRVGAVGAQAGISIDQIAALGSTIDALGGRVEMSATALSRMIPAIKNNSFAIANSIGVTEKYLKSLAPMEQMVLIFQKMRDNIAHIDTTTEQGQEQMAQTIEGMLGKNATMREVMKDLEQQGARAGIVFGLLSQNVDELQKQLGIASEAYRENTALANEFNNMNETTAAKWERLKNQFEEAFVGDSAQRNLGWIIDRLRELVDLLTGDGGVSVALRAIIVYLGLVRLQVISLVKGALASLGGGLKNIGIMLGFIKGEMTTLQWSNIFTALAGAVMYAVYAFSQMQDEARRLKEDLNRLADENDAAVREVNQLVTAFNDATKKADSAGKKHEELKAKTEALRKEVDELKNTTNLSAEATEALNKKEEQLKASEESLKQAADESNQANSTRLQLISEINSKYSTYLGYMLSEKTAAEQVASAHQLIIAALKEELIQKSLNRRQDAINNQYDKAIQDYSVESENELRGIPIQSQQRIMDNFRRVLTSISYNAESQTYSRFAVEGLSKESKDKGADDMRKELRVLLRRIVQQEVADSSGKITNRNLWGRGIQNIDDYIGSIWGGLMDDGFGNWVDTYMSREKEVSKAYHDVGVETQTAHKHSVETATKDIDSNFRAIAKITTDNQELTDDNIRMLAQHVNGITASLEKYNGEIKDVEKYVGKGNNVSLANTVNTLLASLDENTRKRVLDVAQKARGTGKSGNGTGGVPTSSVSPYGTYNRITDSYDKWDADALVTRRKEMLERVRALANGADVQAVLSEDAKFISEATRKNIKDTKQAIEWYNTERLKIQDALHEKHLTNTGDWMDPTKQKARAKVIKDEWSAYLNELDAYYTERKAKIQEQQNDEEISEAEARNRTLANEAEWRQRRAELQKLYARKSAEVTEEEQQAIFDIISERTGDSADFIQKTIGKTVKFIYDIGQKSEAEQRTIFGKLDKGIEQDLLRQRNAIGQHMKDITAIINKENPYAGITEELRKNLGTMDALLTDIEKDEERTVEKEIERTMFILEQSTKGYSLTWEELMREMAKRGWQAWADAVNGDTQTRERLMHQVYRVFEKVQDAIKKEASEMKKQADIMWSNILLPGGDGKTTIKDAFEQTIGALGIEEGRVSRANSLIGAGQASERVADRLAIQQMKVQLAMQQYQYSLVRKIGREKIDSLRKEAQENEAIGDIEKARQLRMQAQNTEMALNLATRKEQTEELKQQEAIIAKTEESEARLYKELREWADLISSSLQSVFEATHAGDAEYYNERAKLALTGKGGPGAGTYIVIDNEGTSDATAHYEYLDEREAMERQHEIERENAMADAWKKVMDDINMKMSETITDQLNAMLQNASLDANTQAVLANTEALYATSGRSGGADMGIGADGIPNALRSPMEGGNNPAVGGSPTDMNGYAAPWQQQPQGEQSNWQVPMAPPEVDAESYTAPWAAFADASKQATETAIGDNKKIEKSTKQSFAAMTAAANMYGIAYQAMSNENLSTAQKVEMMIVQAAGQAMISMLTASLAADTAESASHAPSWISKTLAELGPIGGPVAVGVFTALIGGLIGLATSKITKSKSQIAQVTGASSASAGRLSTGMLTYAEGNVNEFTDPSSLTPGKRYNVDAADGKTYRARYMGRNPKTHLTNGPEFHLSGERGREMIIDAGTTRQITMNEGEIWHAIQTLSGGGSARRFARRGRGIPAFADGNIEDFMDGSVSGDSVAGMSGMSAEQAASLQASIDRQTDLLEDLRINGIKATFDVYGKGGLVDSYDSGKKTLNRYGERY